MHSALDYSPILVEYFPRKGVWENLLKRPTLSCPLVFAISDKLINQKPISPLNKAQRGLL